MQCKKQTAPSNPFRVVPLFHLRCASGGLLADACSRAAQGQLSDRPYKVEHAPGCRIAFHGRVTRVLNDTAQRLQLKIHKQKTKQGVVKRVTDAYTVLVRGLCSKTTGIS